MLQPSLLSGPERFALDGGRSGPFCMLSVSYVLQHYNIVWFMYACGAYIHMSLVDSSMESAALLACINPPLLPLLYSSHQPL
jgi:hypothetical protein